MELLVIVLAFCALGVLAGRYGYDSRDGLPSREELAAAAGMSWGNAEPAQARRPSRPVEEAAQLPLAA